MSDKGIKESERNICFSKVSIANVGKVNVLKQKQVFIFVDERTVLNTFSADYSVYMDSAGSFIVSCRVLVVS